MNKSTNLSEYRPCFLVLFYEYPKFSFFVPVLELLLEQLWLCSSGTFLRSPLEIHHCFQIRKRDHQWILQAGRLSQQRLKLMRN